MEETRFICSRCGCEIRHAGDPVVISALNELYTQPEFAICRECMTKDEKERTLDIVVQKLIEYYASQGMSAVIRRDAQ